MPLFMVSVMVLSSVNSIGQSLPQVQSRSDSTSHHSRSIATPFARFRKFISREVINLDDLSRQLHSPEEISQWVQRHIQYRADKQDEWAPAHETLRRRRGDCEDIAILVQALCDRRGIKSNVYLFFPAGIGAEGHAVAVGHAGNRLWFSDNGSYGEASTLNEIRKRVCASRQWDPNTTWYVSLNLAQVTQRLSSGGPGLRVSSSEQNP